MSERARIRSIRRIRNALIDHWSRPRYDLYLCRLMKAHCFLRRQSEQ
jgi:hypothetical protein